MNANEMIQFVTPDENPGCEHLFVYRDVRVSQTSKVFAALDMLNNAIQDEPAQTIIEIGTLYGGFTRILRDHDISKSAQVHTFDIVTASKGIPDVTYHRGDVFRKETRELVKSLIVGPGRCLVFCDGGNKEREVNGLSAYLKVGDIILCHDYAKDPALAGTPAYGNWPCIESTYANMAKALDANNCSPFMEAAMQQAAWGCFKRSALSEKI